MAAGKIKFFSQQKGFGFIAPDDGSPDIFFHVKGLRDRAAEPDLIAGAAVEFTGEPDRTGRPRAIDVVITG